MKKEFIKYGLCILLMGFMAGCDDYAQKEIQNYIYVDRTSLSLFVGQSLQLTASPTDGTYQYQWLSEDTKVATVTSNGLVEAIGEGSTNIVVRDGDLVTKVPVTSAVRVPLRDVSLGATHLELLPGGKKTILVTYIPDNANDIPKHSWRSENPDVVTVNVAGDITVVGEGVTNIVYQIGDIVKKIEVDAAYTRPFKGPHILSAAAPYDLFAANFDMGGEGYAFHDDDSGDNSGQGGNYRRSNGDTSSDAVDIEGYGQNVGWTGAGEWLLYTVEVIDGGVYKVEAQVAVPGTGSFHLEVNNENVTGTVGVPNTGGWGTFWWISVPDITFTEGRHKIKYYFEGGHNFKSLKFTKK